MPEFTNFFNPMSRALIAQWALLEVGVEFETVLVDWDAKPQALLDANPMGKLPTIIHHRPEGDAVVTECAAICHYLADATSSDLLPSPAEKAAYYRWLFFAAGPLESAIANRTLGWEPADAQQQSTLGFGSFDRTIDALDDWLTENEFTCGSRFTMADVYLGSQVGWGRQFGTIPERDSFRDYIARFATRAAYQQAMGSIVS